MPASTSPLTDLARIAPPGEALRSQPDTAERHAELLTLTCQRITGTLTSQTASTCLSAANTLAEHYTAQRKLWEARAAKRLAEAISEAGAAALAVRTAATNLLRATTEPVRITDNTQETT